MKKFLWLLYIIGLGCVFASAYNIGESLAHVINVPTWKSMFFFVGCVFEMIVSMFVSLLCYHGYKDGGF